MNMYAFSQSKEKSKTLQNGVETFSHRLAVRRKKKSMGVYKFTIAHTSCRESLSLRDIAVNLLESYLACHVIHTITLSYF